MIIRKLLLTWAVIFTASAFGQGESILDTPKYNDTQSSYINDIDAINIVMASLDESCWLNSPYGAPDLKGYGLLEASDCHGLNQFINENHLDPIDPRNIPSLVAVMSMSAPDLQGKGKDVVYDSIVNSIGKISSKILPELAPYFEEKLRKNIQILALSQESMKKDGRLDVATAPQVLTAVITKENKRYAAYLSYFDSAKGSTSFSKITADGGVADIGFKAFNESTGLTLNPLLKR